MVFALDSKISLAGFKPSWRRRHARRARAKSGAVLLAGPERLFLYVSPIFSSA